MKQCGYWNRLRVRACGGELHCVSSWHAVSYTKRRESYPWGQAGEFARRPANGTVLEHRQSVNTIFLHPTISRYVVSCNRCIYSTQRLGLACMHAITPPTSTISNLSIDTQSLSSSFIAPLCYPGTLSPAGSAVIQLSEVNSPLGSGMRVRKNASRVLVVP